MDKLRPTFGDRLEQDVSPESAANGQKVAEVIDDYVSRMESERVSKHLVAEELAVRVERGELTDYEAWLVSCELFIGEGE